MKEFVDQLLDVNRKAEALMSRKWITLQGAREHMLSHLLPDPRRLTAEEHEDVARAIYGKEATTEFGILVAHADRHGRSILIRAFATDLPTRGVEQLADAKMDLHDPLPRVWWHRVVDRIDNKSVGDEHPFHFPLWIQGAIQRHQSGRAHEAPLAAITNVQVNYEQLLKLAKPTPGAKKFSTSIKAKAVPWLYQEAAQRKEEGGPNTRDDLVTALRSKFSDIPRTTAIKMVEELPDELRAPRGRRPSKEKSGRS